MDKKKSEKNTAKKENHGRKITERGKHRHAALIVLGVAIGVALGIFVSALYFERQAKLGSVQDSLSDKQAGIGSEALANQEKTAPLAPIAGASSAIYTFSGTVIKTEGNKIYVDYFSCGKGHKTYSVSVSKNTVIVKRENQQENKAALSDVKANDNVAVQASEDINEKSDLTAREIKIMGKTNLSSSDTESQNK